MKIRRLKLSGFKSFVEPSELSIEPGLTGVVGPNGCGKSNLLEAIRWVMGEGSPKSLRGDGMEDVIFAGTATRPARDFAEVSLLVERDGEGAANEGEVTRRIERGAGSAYRIDGRDVRAKDVSLLFADAATGAHSPALVSQGKVGSIIAAKPTERRLLLEEAAGIAGLHARRKDAEQKLRAAEANLTRLSELLGEQEQRAAALRRQARAAERYRQLTGKIRSVEARLVHARWAEADAAAEQARRDAASAEQEVEQLRIAVESSRTAQEKAEALLAERRRATSEARARGSEIAHQLATARARRDTVTRRLAELDRLDTATSSDIDRELALKDDSGRAFAQLDEERAAIERRLADSEGEAARLATELSEMEAASRNAEAALAELLARQAAMRAERRVGEAALESARAHAARVGGERDKLKQQLHDLSDGSDNQRARDEALARARTAEKSRLDSELRLAEAEDGRSAAADLRDSAESELAKARAALSAARAEHDAMARALQQGGGSAVAKLRAEPGYEQALAAALGDDADAGIGSEGPRRWQGSEPATGDPRLAQGLECLADHVEAPAELGRRLRQVGVADEDRGQPLEVGQRLVTRDGRMRRWDGFVAEGSGAAAAERLIRANRLAELARQLPGLEARVTQCETARRDSAERLDSLRQQADSARAEATAAEREIRDAERSSDSAAAAIERIQAQRESLEQRLGDLDPVIRAAAEAVGAAETALGALADPSDLEAQVEAARQAAAQAGKAVADKRAEAATRGRE
ncbi:MAG: AAA family ATPase, partial [Pseudomonadota bacterium]|nr:AAA family ATPase [Pseudomonadota bacterium]